jgi:hypothetical protein
MAPYLSVDDSQTGTLDALFTALDQTIGSMDPTFQDLAMLVQQYGLPIAGYEGGQSLTRTTNQPIKHLAQHGARPSLVTACTSGERGAFSEGRGPFGFSRGSYSRSAQRDERA